MTTAPSPSTRILPYWFGPVAMLAGAVAAAILGGGIVAGIVSGAGPVLPPGGLFGIGNTAKDIVTDPGAPGAAWGEGCTLGGPVIVWGSITVIVVVYAVLVGLCSSALDRRRRSKQHAQNGFADKAELRRQGLDESSARKAGITARPSLASVPWNERRQIDSSDVAIAVGQLWHAPGKELHTQFRDGVLIEGPTGSGKTWRLAWRRVVEAPGFCLATTTKADLLWSTVGERAAHGRVAVFDPEGISAWPDTMRWSIVAGCDDPDTALRRAHALAQAMPMTGAKNASYFIGKATVLLRSYLYAAARMGATIRQVRMWVSSRTVEDVLDVLGAELPDWAVELKQMLGSQADSSEDMIGAAASLLDPLASPALMAAVDVPAEDSVDLESLVRDGATLYLLSDGAEGKSLAPFISTLAAEVHHVAKEYARTLDQERLDPPAMFVLDEVNNIARIPNLPDSLITVSGGQGICLWCFAHSARQNRNHWGPTGDEFTSNSPVRIILPGLADDQELTGISRLLGDKLEYHGPRMAPQRVPVMPAADVRRMPAGQALVIYRGAKPALLRLPAVWDVPELKDRVEASRAYYERVCREGATVDAA